MQSISVRENILQEVLQPYRKYCQYLKSAVVEYPHLSLAKKNTGLAKARGEFEIPESWYIDSTGHFNSIEFNLCYNQLIYILLAQCIIDSSLPELNSITFNEFKKIQLPAILIVRFSCSFRKPMAANNFTGETSINRILKRNNTIFIKTDCKFSHNNIFCSEGNIDLAIVDRVPESL